jgi:hypothetical protein
MSSILEKELIVANSIRILPVYCHSLDLALLFHPMMISGKDLKISTLREWIPIGNRIQTYMISCENPKIAEYDLLVFFKRKPTDEQFKKLILWVYLEEGISYKPLLEKIPNIQWEWFKLKYREYIHSS